MRILAIDPGPEQSAYVIWDGERILDHAKVSNSEMLFIVSEYPNKVCVIEQVASYGMAVGAEVFETVFWSGRFAEAACKFFRLPRLTVKLHLCHDSRAKDANIRAALLDRFGGKDRAIGRKAAPGPLYGVSGDVWAALALAVTWWDRQGYEVAAAAVQREQIVAEVGRG